MAAPALLPRLTPRPGPDDLRLRCPCCGEGFALTWARYLGAPWGNHRCPHCRAALRLRRSILSHAGTIAGAVLVACLAGWAAHALTGSVEAAQWAWILVYLCVGLSWDRVMDVRRGRLVPRGRAASTAAPPPRREPTVGPPPP